MSLIKLNAPPMGWNSYCTVNCDPSEQLLLDNAKLLVQTGLRDAGYVYLNLDDGWLKPERDENGELQYREDIFPNGMKYLTDKLHEMGLKAGTYLGNGVTTWHEDAGSADHEYEDARKIAEWGFDYLKYDRHPGDVPRDVVCDYIRMGKALASCGRDMVYNLCEHGTSSPWLWAAGTGSLWRIGEDVRDNFIRTEEKPHLGIMNIVDNFVAKSVSYGGKDAYCDPDMIVVGMRQQNNWMGPGMSDDEYITNFSLWCMFPAPLLIGADLSRIAPEMLEILKNPRLIAIDQDPLGIPARRIASDPEGREVWFRILSDFRFAVAIVNRGKDIAEESVTWDELGLSAAVPFHITDAWSGDVIAKDKKDGITLSVPSHGTRVLLLDPNL